MNAAALLALQNIDSALTAIDNRRPRLAELAAHRAAQQQVADLTASIAAAAARAAGAAATIERLEHEATELTAKRTLAAKKGWETRRAKKTRATLLVARLDRLSRSVSMIARILDATTVADLLERQRELSAPSRYYI